MAHSQLPTKTPQPGMISQAGHTFPAIVAVLTSEEKQTLLSGTGHLNRWGWHKDAQAMMDLVCRLAVALHNPLIQWTAGATPDTDQDEDYWVVIRHVSSGDTFVELSRYWGSVKAWSMDRHRFAVLAYSKANTPAVPAAYLTGTGPSTAQ